MGAIPGVEPPKPVDALPSGTVTFLLTDVEQSTRLWEEQPEAMRRALARHDELLTDSIVRHGGRVVKSTGDGILAVFAIPDRAVAAAIDGQIALDEEHWGAEDPLHVRMAINTGVPQQRDADYFGPVLNRLARLVEVTHPGQIICAQATADLVRDALPTGAELVDLGRHRLRDLTRAEVVFQVRHPALMSDFPPVPSLDALPGNLPSERTPLVGRERELAQLASLLDDHRLLTLTGVGGVGKTRLATQLAADVVDRFDDGAWFVALASIRDPELVSSTVAAVLGIPERSPRPAIDVLCDAMRRRRVLLVLDNCEHLLDAAAQLVDALLDAGPGLRIIASSREALGVGGEQSWPTPSLGLPPTGVSDAGDDIAAAEAVRLFVERARAVRPDFVLSPANAGAVADICRRLDGIALAIELAAARVGALSPQDILQRIDQRFVLLTGGARTAMERHQTLRAAVDWSYDLLAERERRLFDRLSVFVGGFTLIAACSVAGDPGTTEVEVLDLLSGLVAKSMVIATGSGSTVRYSLLETLRQYGRERLAAAGDVNEIRDRHAHYYTELEVAQQTAFFTCEQVSVAGQRVLDADNRRTAFDWWLERREPLLALRLLGYPLPTGTGSSEHLRMFEVALDLASGLPAEDLVAPLGFAAWIAVSSGSFERAKELAAESLARAEAAGMRAESWAFVARGLAAFWQGDAAAAVEAMEHAIELAREAIDHSGLRESQLTGALGQACFVLAQLGDTTRAIAFGEEALARLRGQGMTGFWAMTLRLLGLAYRRVDPARAAQLLEDSLAVPPMPGLSTTAEGWTHVAVAQIRTALGDHTGAVAAYRMALEMGRLAGDSFFLPTTLEGLAYIARKQERLEEATRLLAAADGLAHRFGVASAADAAGAARARGRLRELLGDDCFERAWRSTHDVSIDEAMTLATAATTLGSPEGRRA